MYQVNDIGKSTERYKGFPGKKLIDESTVAVNASKDEPSDGDGPGKTMQRAVRNSNE